MPVHGRRQQKGKIIRRFGFPQYSHISIRSFRPGLRRYSYLPGKSTRLFRTRQHPFPGKPGMDRILSEQGMKKHKHHKDGHRPPNAVQLSIRRRINKTATPSTISVRPKVREGRPLFSCSVRRSARAGAVRAFLSQTSPRKTPQSLLRSPTARVPGPFLYSV